MSMTLRKEEWLNKTRKEVACLTDEELIAKRNACSKKEKRFGLSGFFTWLVSMGLVTASSFIFACTSLLALPITFASVGIAGILSSGVLKYESKKYNKKYQAYQSEIILRDDLKKNGIEAKAEQEKKLAEMPKEKTAEEIREEKKKAAEERMAQLTKQAKECKQLAISFEKELGMLQAEYEQEFGSAENNDTVTKSKNTLK